MLQWVPIGDEHVAVGRYRRHSIAGKEGDWEVRTQRPGIPLYFDPVAARTGSLEHAKQISEDLEARAAAETQPGDQTWW
jgi:hypothetical protein